MSDELNIHESYRNDLRMALDCIQRALTTDSRYWYDEYTNAAGIWIMGARKAL